MKQPDSPFFLAINHRRQPSSQIWYSKAALGKNKIGKFLSKAAKAAKLPGNITNHSVRKTCISRLMDADIPENFVAQLSGHKNLKSLESYKSASTAHQRKMSLVLSPSTPPSCATDTYFSIESPRIVFRCIIPFSYLFFSTIPYNILCSVRSAPAWTRSCSCEINFYGCLYIWFRGFHCHLP